MLPKVQAKASLLQFAGLKLRKVDAKVELLELVLKPHLDPIQSSGIIVELFLYHLYLDIVG